MDINKVINDALASVLEEGETSDAVIAHATSSPGRIIKDVGAVAGAGGEVLAAKGRHALRTAAEDTKEAVSKAGKKVAEAASDAKDKAEEVGGEVKEKATSMGKKALEAVEDNPKMSAAIAAALAAGVGGLALRKRLKAAAKK